MPRFCARFQPPSSAKQLAAIGLDNDGNGKALPRGLCKCFDPSLGEWENIDTPRPSEWLEDMLDKTPDQSFQDFVRSRPNKPDRGRNTIYLQPLCKPEDLMEAPFPVGPWPSWQILEAAVQRFYAPLEVRTLPATPMTALRPTPPHRKSRGFGTQWNATRILDAINVPKDAYCVLAVTMCDLYPRDEWNFVYGLARLTGRVGVFSFVRHTPDVEDGTEAWREATMLHSSMKTMLHEIGHMFGMKHCTWYNCLMRGSNGAMVEHQPNYLHLCPVCLHKLQWSIGCSIPSNYVQLLDLFQPFEESSEAFKVDCDFLRKRLAALEDVPIPTATHERPMRQRPKNVIRAPRGRSLPSKGTNATLENDAMRSGTIESRSRVDVGRVGPHLLRSNSSAATPRSFRSNEVLRRDVKRPTTMSNDQQIGQAAKS